MKKNFKKSKFVILPALATLVLTGVASVTGTVAWFTANRAATVTGSNFITTKTDSSLSVTMTAGTGTTISDNGDNHSVSVKGKMTHGSYDAKANAEGSLYVASLNDNKEVTAYLDKKKLSENTTTTQGDTSTTTYHWAQKYSSTDENCVWYGVSWTMKFTYSAASDSETNYLLFDTAGSSFKGTAVGSDTGTGDTYKGFRIALMTTDKYLVLGGDSEKKYVTGTSINDTASFDEAKFENVNASTSTKSGKLNDNAEGVKDGKFSFGAIDGTTGVEITCVAWFEGEDSTSIVDKIQDIDTVMSNVSSTLSFYTRSVNA